MSSSSSSDGEMWRDVCGISDVPDEVGSPTALGIRSRTALNVTDLCVLLVPLEVAIIGDFSWLTK